MVVLLTVYRYAEYCFVLVEKAKSAKNIWEPVFEDVIILGFLMADTSSKRQKIYIFCKISQKATSIYKLSLMYARELQI